MSLWYSLLSCILLMACRTSPTDHSSNARPEHHATDSVHQAPPSLKIDLPVPNGWVDLKQADSTIALDIRYATQNNFVDQKMYPCGRCLLRNAAAAKVLELQERLKKMGLGLKFYDCYRPRPVQEQLWKKVPDARYVAPPNKGSMHNRGVAVDVTLIDLQTGQELPMGTDYDFFGEEAYHSYLDHPSHVMQNRQLLREKMAEVQFRHIRTEWWHYSFTQGSHEMADFMWDCPNDYLATPDTN